MSHLQEYMQYRHHRYIRLDGSSRISERRDMVDDFQTKCVIITVIVTMVIGGSRFCAGGVMTLHRLHELQKHY